MQYANTWGAQNSNVDQQRGDLFKVTIEIPSAVLGDTTKSGGAGNVWDQHISWAVEKFEFPDRVKDSIPIKYLQQTNHQIGGDAASDAITMPIRYAFNQRTAELLERWWWMIANPRTGGVALSSSIKTTGTYCWLVPKVGQEGNLAAPEAQAYSVLKAYNLHGVWIKSLKPSGGDMTASNNLVTLDMHLQIDRYFPATPADLTMPTAKAQ